jgi:hypothetical protein
MAVLATGGTIGNRPTVPGMNASETVADPKHQRIWNNTSLLVMIVFQIFTRSDPTAGRNLVDIKLGTCTIHPGRKDESQVEDRSIDHVP